jgi:hypothetical protein
MAWTSSNLAPIKIPEVLNQKLKIPLNGILKYMNYVGNRRFILQKVFVPKGSRVQETFGTDKKITKRWNPHYDYIIYDANSG